MNERLEQFGTPCSEPEPVIEKIPCPGLCCDRTIRPSQKIGCDECGYIGCKACMITNGEGEWFCDETCENEYEKSFED